VLGVVVALLGAAVAPVATWWWALAEVTPRQGVACLVTGGVLFAGGLLAVAASPERQP